MNFILKQKHWYCVIFKKKTSVAGWKKVDVLFCKCAVLLDSQTDEELAIQESVSFYHQHGVGFLWSIQVLSMISVRNAVRRAVMGVEFCLYLFTLLSCWQKPECPPLGAPWQIISGIARAFPLPTRKPRIRTKMEIILGKVRKNQENEERLKECSHLAHWELRGRLRSRFLQLRAIKDVRDLLSKSLVGFVNFTPSIFIIMAI